MLPVDGARQLPDRVAAPRRDKDVGLGAFVTDGSLCSAAEQLVRRGKRTNVAGERVGEQASARVGDALERVRAPVGLVGVAVIRLQRRDRR